MKLETILNIFLVNMIWYDQNNAINDITKNSEMHSKSDQNIQEGGLLKGRGGQNFERSEQDRIRSLYK